VPKPQVVFEQIPILKPSVTAKSEKNNAVDILSDTTQPTSDKAQSSIIGRAWYTGVADDPGYLIVSSMPPRDTEKE